MERTRLLICIGLLGYIHSISAAALGAACTVDGDCTVPGVSDTKCQNLVCKLLATKSCTGNTDKCVDNADCSGTGSTCACKTGYKASGANLCLASLGTTCTADADCDSTTVVGTICDTYRSMPVCALKDTATCTSNTDKCVYGASCVSTACTCGTGYTATANKCLASLGTACQASTGCASTVAGTVCDTYRSKPVCALKDTATCTSNTDKCVYGASCVSSACACGTGYTAATADKLCLASLGTACQASTGCATTVAGTICDVLASTAICAIGAGSSCSIQTTKCVSGATCSTTGTLCACNAGYTQKADKTCSAGSASVVASIVLIITLLGTAVF